MKNSLALCLCAFLLLSGVACANTLGVFVVNFNSKRTSDLTNFVSNQIDALDTLAIVDARDASLVLLKDKTSIPPGQGHILVNNIMKKKFGDPPLDYLNLAASLDMVNDIVRPLPNQYNKINLYVLDSIYQKDSSFDFSEGYPNDGFLIGLKDSDFYYISPLQDTKYVEMHVLNTEPFKFTEKYQRFFDYLAKRVFNNKSKLVSFNDQLLVGGKPDITISALDGHVTRSEVIKGNVTPSCEYEDKLNYSETADFGLNVEVANPCRRNSVVAFYYNQSYISARADDAGKAELKIALHPGNNIVELQQLDNRRKVVFEKDINARDDDIDVVVENNVAHLTGKNPLRQDGQKVKISHIDSGREWEIGVSQGRYEVNLPISQGKHILNISRMNGGEPQKIVVNNGSSCSDNINYEVSNGTLHIYVTNHCRKGRQVTFEYEGKKYTAAFNNDGVADKKISLFKIINDITYDTIDGDTRHIEIRLSSLQDIIKVTLIWDDPVDLDLHVLEPNTAGNIMTTSPGHIFFHNKNEHHDSGLGFLDIDDTASGSGQHQENYVVEKSKLSHGILDVRVDYFARGNTPSGDKCGNGSLSTIPFKLIVMNQGVVDNEVNYRVKSQPCNIQLQPDARIERYKAINVSN